MREREIKATSGAEVAKPVERMGRDEMNLAELPFFLLSNRSPKGVNQLEFTYDMSSGKESIRTHLTIKGDTQYGFPTAREEEVVLAFLQISRDYNRYEDPKVYFTQRQLLNELGWGTRGAAYKRLEDSLFCLQGVRYRVVGWRDNAQKTFTTKGGFSLISDFELRDSRRKDGTRASTSDETLSYFVWGRTLFESFQTGYLKKLNYELVSGFKTTLSKRLYRYLDKHFNPPHYTRIVLPLKPFAHERMAMSRKADYYEIQRQMEPAIEELTAHGFIEKQSWTERVSKKSHERRIEFRMKLSMSGNAPSRSDVSRSLAGEELISRGVDREVATKLVDTLAPGNQDRAYTFGRLRYVMDLYDFKKKRGISCTPGFLVEGVRREAAYAPDDGFSPEKRNAGSKPNTLKQKRQSDEAKQVAETKEIVSKLSESEKRSLEASALERQPSTFHEYYDRFRRTDQARFDELRTFLIGEELARQRKGE